MLTKNPQENTEKLTNGMSGLYFKAQVDELEKSYCHKTLSLNSHIPPTLPLPLPYPKQYTSHTHHHLIRIFIFTLHKLVFLYIHIEPAYKPNSVTYPSYSEKLNA